MHAIMATMVLRPISSYKKRRLHLQENRNSVINEEEKSLLSPQTVIKDISTDPIVGTDTKESRALDENVSDDDVQLREGRDDPLPRKCNKVDFTSPECESPGGDALSSQIANALGISNQNGADLPKCCSFKKIPLTVHCNFSLPGARCDGVVDFDSLLSDGSLPGTSSDGVVDSGSLLSNGSLSGASCDGVVDSGSLLSNGSLPGASCDGVVDSGSLLSDGSLPSACCDGLMDFGSHLSGVSGLKVHDQAGGSKNVCCRRNKIPINNSLKAQSIYKGSLQTLCDRSNCNKPDKRMAFDEYITDTLIHLKNAPNKPVLDRANLDIYLTDKGIINNSLSYDMQSNDIKTYDTEASFLQSPGIDAHVIQTPDLHVIQMTSLQSLDTQTPDQDKTNIVIFGNDRRDHSLTRSVPSSYPSASFSIIGRELDIQTIAEDQTANEVFEEPKSEKVCNMISWIKVIINFPLLKNVTCLTIISIYCLINGGELNMMYLPSYARQIGIAPQEAALLLTIFGACDIVARILSGYFVDLKIVKVHVIMGVTIFCSGVVNHCLGMFHTFELLILYVIIHGLIGCVGASLDNVLVVETLGIGYLSMVLPMCSLFLNVSLAAQQLIVGALIEYTENYVVAFQYVGSMYLLSSVLLLGLPIVTRLQQKREQQN